MIISETDGRRRKNWRGPRHRMKNVPNNHQGPGFLICIYCDMEHTIGHELGRPKGMFYKFPGGEWTKYKDGRTPIPICPKGIPIVPIVLTKSVTDVKVREAADNLAKAVRLGVFGATIDQERVARAAGFEDPREWVESALNSYYEVIKP